MIQDLAKKICRMEDPEDKDLTDVGYERAKHITQKAVLFDIDGEDVWLPFSQIGYVDEEKQAVSIATWLAEEKNLT